MYQTMERLNHPLGVRFRGFVWTLDEGASRSSLDIRIIVSPAVRWINKRL